MSDLGAERCDELPYIHNVETDFGAKEPEAFCNPTWLEDLLVALNKVPWGTRLVVSNYLLQQLAKRLQHVGWCADNREHLNPEVLEKALNYDWRQSPSLQEPDLYGQLPPDSLDGRIFIYEEPDSGEVCTAP